MAERYLKMKSIRDSSKVAAERDWESGIHRPKPSEDTSKMNFKRETFCT